VGWEAEEMANRLEKSQTLLLENLRFHAEEEANEEKFSRQLAALADVYVNDAFGSAHRAHASTAGITKFVDKAAAGLLMQKELEQAKSKNVRLVLPVDYVVANKIDAAAATHIVKDSDGIPTDQMGLDIGPDTVAIFSKEIAAAKTIVWNGPMGVFEVAPFAK